MISSPSICLICRAVVVNLSPVGVAIVSELVWQVIEFVKFSICVSPTVFLFCTTWTFSNVVWPPQKSLENNYVYFVLKMVLFKVIGEHSWWQALNIKNYSIFNRYESLKINIFNKTYIHYNFSIRCFIISWHTHIILADFKLRYDIYY